MQKIEDLFEGGDFEKVLELTENSIDPKEIFVRISSYIELGKREEALKALLDHREPLFKARPIMTMRADFELRFALNQFDEAYDDLGYFNNLPYVSQEVEEALRAFPKIIREEEKASLLQGQGKEKDLRALLNSSDPYAVLGALSQIGNKRLKGYEAEIEKILVSSPYADVKSFALEVLVAEGYDKEVRFLNGEDELRIIPKELCSPFDEPGYANLRKMLKTLKDSSLQSVCVKLLDQIALSSFPHYPFKEGPLSSELEALISLGKEYLGEPGEGDEGLKKEMDRFKAILAKHPPLP